MYLGNVRRFFGNKKIFLEICNACGKNAVLYMSKIFFGTAFLPPKILLLTGQKEGTKWRISK